MFGIFKRKSGSPNQVDDTLIKMAEDKLKDPEFKQAINAELERIADKKDVPALETALLGLQMGHVTISQLLNAL